MNKKGGLFDIFIVLIVMLTMFIFFASFMYGFGLMTDKVTDITIPTDIVNVSQAGEDVFGKINAGLSALKWLALIITFSMVIAIMVSNYLVRASPSFYFVYVLITVIGIVFAVNISNAYESILTPEGVLTPTLQSFSGMNYLMLNLPIFITIVGLLGALFLFIGIIVDRDSGGSIPT
jgi:hypothetical protein